MIYRSGCEALLGWLWVVVIVWIAWVLIQEIMEDK